MTQLLFGIVALGANDLPKNVTATELTANLPITVKSLIFNLVRRPICRLKGFARGGPPRSTRSPCKALLSKAQYLQRIAQSVIEKMQRKTSQMAGLFDSTGGAITSNRRT
jgi:hypothetical protein